MSKRRNADRGIVIAIKRPSRNFPRSGGGGVARACAAGAKERKSVVAVVIIVIVIVVVGRKRCLQVESIRHHQALGGRCDR